MMFLTLSNPEQLTAAGQYSFRVQGTQMDGDNAKSGWLDILQQILLIFPFLGIGNFYRETSIIYEISSTTEYHYFCLNE